MLCRLFVDEVGNGDLSGAATDDNVRYLSLTGIITKQGAHARHFQPKLDQLKAELFGHTKDKPIILHRREIVRREGPFTVLRDPATAQKFDAGILHLMDSLPYIAATVVIDKREHLQRYTVWRMDPYHYCLRSIVERYVLWMRRHDLRGDVVTEPRYKKADKRVKASFRAIYERGTEYIPAHVVQKYILSHDIGFSPKSANVAGMQLCDLLAHPSYRSMRHERDGISPPQDFGGSVAEILLRNKYARVPTDHSRINGWGRIWLP